MVAVHNLAAAFWPKEAKSFEPNTQFAHDYNPAAIRRGNHTKDT